MKDEKENRSIVFYCQPLWAPILNNDMIEL